MQLTISKKLILSFLGLTILVLIATLGLARWSFERGFLDYVNALEAERLKSISASLTQEYLIADNSWKNLSEKRFITLLGRDIRERPSRLPRFNSSENHVGDSHPPPPNLRPNLGQPRRPPPPKFPSPVNLPGNRPPLAQGGQPPSNVIPFGPPTALFNAKGKQIMGPPLIEGSNPISVPILINGKAVGEIRSAPRRHFDSPQETSFSKQQLTTSALIAAFSLVLALLASWLLTRVLLSPIKRMIRGVSNLSNGDYSSRLSNAGGETNKDELGKLMKDLDQLAHKLEENRTSRRRWLADISHELRTPITVLTGEIEILKDGIRPFDKQQLLSLDQEVSRLRHLVDDLYELSVSDIGGLRYSLSPINIKESLDSIVESTKRRAKEKEIDLEIVGETGFIVNADVQRLDQLFTNIIENSLSYTDAPGKLLITLSGNKKEASITFQDTPPGVSKEECKELFEPLYRQEKSRSRRTAGAGLGLAICKNIVDAHQGRVTAIPSALGGLCIEVVFPILREK